MSLIILVLGDLLIFLQMVKVNVQFCIRNKSTHTGSTLVQ
jgi:hypothetical protein